VRKNITIEAKWLLKSHRKPVLKKAHGRPGQLHPLNNLYSWVKLRVALTIHKTVLTAFLTHACVSLGYSRLPPTSET
jgi:hypothetical protein